MSDLTCDIEGCGMKHYARSWCRKHYRRWQRHGSPLTLLQPHVARGAAPRERVQAAVATITEAGCWLARPALLNPGNGYSTINIGQGAVLGHRFAYQAYVGPIADGLTVDHLCRVRICLNPAHMELVSRAENTRRMWVARKAVSA